MNDKLEIHGGNPVRTICTDVPSGYVLTREVDH